VGRVYLGALLDPVRGRAGAHRGSAQSRSSARTRLYSRARLQRRRSRLARTSRATSARTRLAPLKARHRQYRPRSRHHLSRRLRPRRRPHRNVRRHRFSCSHRLRSHRRHNDRCSHLRHRNCGKCSRHRWHMRHLQRRPARLHRLPRSHRRNQARSRRRKNSGTEFGDSAEMKRAALEAARGLLSCCLVSASARS
jgi:hypothetical protein